MSILAKPSGITLADHTQHLHEQSNEYFTARPNVAVKYHKRTGEDLFALLQSAIDWHDQGKKHPAWQSACLKDNAEYIRTKGKKTGANLRQTGIRHEMDSLRRARDAGRQLAPSVHVAVAAHHSKLSHRHANRWQTDDGGKFATLWEGLLTLNGTMDYGAFDEAIAERYRFSGIRSLLQLFDHRASAKEAKATLPKFDTFSYTFPKAWQKRGVQITVADLYKEPVGILRAPTGSGKTDAALLWAKHQIEHGRADRLVIAMPTRFTASALAIATARTLSSTGVYHSSAWIQRDDKSDFAQKQHELARLLETPITVTTIDHLCISLTGRREDHHAIFWGMANACVVIDESDFYDAFTQANIVVLLRALRLLDVPVLIMSATIPDSFRQLYARSGYAIEAIVEDTDKAEDVRCRVIRHESRVEKPEDVSELLEQGKNREPLIIYANTVARAQAYFAYLTDNGFEDVVLYHSRFTETDKKRIEGELLAMLGKEAWESGTQHGIAVLTQIGELSVNISADRMISDLAPLDRLVQRIGRLSRFADNVGEITIINPLRKGEPYPAPYGEYRSGRGWTAADALTQTDLVFEAGEYTREQLVTMVDALYPSVAEDTERVKMNRVKLEENCVNNWLIVPMRQMAIDADEDEEWSCRDIGPQRTIYAEWSGDSMDAIDAKTHFPSWMAFREYAQPRAINIPVYTFNDAMKNSWLEEQTILIGDDEAKRELDEEKIHIITQHYYSDRGVQFPGLED